MAAGPISHITGILGAWSVWMHTALAPDEGGTHRMTCDLWSLKSPEHLACPTPHMSVQVALAAQWLCIAEPLTYSSLE